MSAPQLDMFEWYHFHKIRPLRMIGTVEIEPAEKNPHWDPKYKWNLRVNWDKVGPYASSYTLGIMTRAESYRDARTQAFHHAQRCAETTYGCPDRRCLSSVRRKVQAELTFDSGEAIKVETTFDHSTLFFWRPPKQRKWDKGIPREFFNQEGN